MPEPRYVVGIDLGTTNSVVAYVDTHREALDVDAPPVEVFPIPQLVKAGLVEARPQLPSFLYLPAENELKAESLALPWTPRPDRLVGTFARSRGAEVPRRVVTSAKSYLCAVGADPTQPILPWGAPDDVERLSAVDAQAAYLAHLRAAWDHAMDAPLAEQDVSLAVPASFDAAARDLTMRAAATAGLDRVRLLEEPQAAFYAWLASTRGGWRERVRVGEVILVCDVGGGRTGRSRSSARPSATTFCSVATTWTSRSRTSWRGGSPRTARSSTSGSSAASCTPAGRRRSTCSAPSPRRRRRSSSSAARAR
jgi:molecular chaperone DnaK (HSP70)